MRAGDLRQRVTVQVRTEGSDGHDGLVETWAPVQPARRSAQVLPLVGRDLERAQQVDPRVSHRMRLRYWRTYQADLDGGRVHVVYHPTSDSADDRTFEIVSPPIDLEERHIELQVLCREAA